MWRFLRVCVLVGVGLVLLAPLGVVAWQHRRPDSPVVLRTTVERFLNAYLARDRETLRQVLTRKAAPVADRLGLAFPTTQLTIEVGAPTVNYLNAFLPFRFAYDEAGKTSFEFNAFLDRAEMDRQVQQFSERLRSMDGTRGMLRLVKEEDTWRVRGMAYPASEINTLDMVDFELVAGTEQGPAGTKEDPLALIQPIDQAGYERAWKSWWGRQGVWAGPFSVSAGHVSDFQATATGQLPLTITGQNLPPTVRALMEVWPPLRPEVAVTSATGKSLVNTWLSRRQAGPMTRKPVANQPQTMLQFDWQVPLRHLTAEITELHKVVGTLEVPLPSKVTPGELAIDDRGGLASIAGVTLRFEFAKTREVTRAGSLKARLLATGPPDRVVVWQAFGPGGVPGATQALSCPDEKEVEVPADTSKLRCKVVTVQRLRHEFTLKNVPLPNRAPLAIAPVLFPGKVAPVTVTLLNEKLPKLSVRIANHTQKKIEQLELRLRPFDSAGKALQESTTFLERRSWLAGMVSGLELPEAMAQDTREFEVKVPAQANRVQVALEAVLFSDGTTWPEGR